MMCSPAMIDHRIDPTDRPEQLVARVVQLASDPLPVPPHWRVRSRLPSRLATADGRTWLHLRDAVSGIPQGREHRTKGLAIIGDALAFSVYTAGYSERPISVRRPCLTAASAARFPSDLPLFGNRPQFPADRVRVITS